MRPDGWPGRVHPVADLDRLVELHREAGHHVAEGVLGEPDHRGEHRARRDEAGDQIGALPTTMNTTSTLTGEEVDQIRGSVSPTRGSTMRHMRLIERQEREQAERQPDDVRDGLVALRVLERTDRDRDDVAAVSVPATFR
jgi:hypothetical protein